MELKFVNVPLNTILRLVKILKLAIIVGIKENTLPAPSLSIWWDRLDDVSVMEGPRFVILKLDFVRLTNNEVSCMNFFECKVFYYFISIYVEMY